MKFKFKNIVLVSLLAVAGILGIGTAIINDQNNNAPVAEKANAGSSHTIYYATTTSRSNYYARCKYGDNWYGSHTFSLAGRSGSYYIYTASVFEEYGGLNNLWIKYGDNPTGDTGTLVVEAINTWTLVSAYENKVYHSSSWKNIYTITYNPNGGNGSTKTDYKINGVAYSILSYASAGISAAGGRHAVKWSTNTSGTGNDYQPGASYSTNANLSLYFIEDWYTYQISTDGGSNWTTLTKTDDTPSGYVAQFKTPSTYSFTAGDTVTFQRYYGTESATSVTISAGEENINSSGVIYYSADGNLYLKVTNADGHTAYVEGFSERGIVVVRGSKDYKCACSKDSTTQWHANSITLLPGDTLKGTYNGGTPYTIYVENTDLYGITTAGVVSTPGVYTIYLKSTDGGTNFPNVYLSMETDNTAKLIAQTFNTALTTVCNSTVSGGATSQITSAFSTQKNYYDHLTDEAQTAVKSGSSDTDVVAMRAKYDYIVGKYGTTIAPDYMSRNPAPIAGLYNIGAIFGTEDNFSTIIIIISSSVALLSVTALSILVIRKRKSKEQ